jgi:hypothetical protein
MDEIGGHHIKRSKPHVFSHMWKIDKKDTNSYVEHIFI